MIVLIAVTLCYNNSVYGFQVALGQDHGSGTSTTEGIVVSISNDILIAVANFLTGFAQVAIPLGNFLGTVPSVLTGLASNTSTNVFSIGTLVQQALETGVQTAAINLGKLLKSGGIFSLQLFSALSSLLPILQQLQTSGLGVAGAFGNVIKEIITDALNITALSGNRLLTGLTNAASGAALVGGAVAQGAAQTATTAATGAISTAGETATQAAKSITDFGKTITNSFANFFG